MAASSCWAWATSPAISPIRQTTAGSATSPNRRTSNGLTFVGVTQLDGIDISLGRVAGQSCDESGRAAWREYVVCQGVSSLPLGAHRFRSVTRTPLGGGRRLVECAGLWRGVRCWVRQRLSSGGRVTHESGCGAVQVGQTGCAEVWQGAADHDDAIEWGEQRANARAQMSLSGGSDRKSCG